MRLAEATIGVTKHPAVGGNGGHEFDSGCNPSGVAKISIECGCFNWEDKEYRSLIKRILIVFNEQAENAYDAIYFGHGVDNPDKGNRIFTFELLPDDEIVKVVVWSDQVVVNALQFHTRRGMVSPRYGIPLKTSEPFEFKGAEECESRLVGIHGRFGGVIDSLGFTFGSVNHPTPSVIGGSWGLKLEEVSFASSVGEVLDIHAMPCE